MLVPMEEDRVDSSEFIVKAPDLQAGLSLEIESGVKPKEFINRYWADYDVRCAFCAAHTAHRRGFTVRMEDGRIALCGIDCARHFFGDEVASRFAEDLERQIDQETRRKIIAQTVEGAPKALAVLDEDWIEVERAYAAAVQGLNLWLEGHDVAEDLIGEALTLSRRRKIWVSSVARDGRQVERQETVEEVQARVRGARCLLMRDRPLGKARGGMVSLANWAGRPELIKGKVVQDLMDRRRAVIDLVHAGIDFARLAHSFFQQENIGHFVTWYRRTFSGDQPVIQLGADRRLMISHPEPDGLPTILVLPHELPDPEFLLRSLISRRA